MATLPKEVDLLSKNEKIAVLFVEYLKNCRECSPKRIIAI